MKIVNPATGERITDIETDDKRAVRKKYQRARVAQPAWAMRPIQQRLACIASFRDGIIAREEKLARTLTIETGKPIRQSRNELKGLVGRLDFFLKEAPRTLREETVLSDTDAKLTERISHEPLGVIANISAWNYPYFVGGNVFVPALVAGNAVLYKPSEYATLTGLAIADLLKSAGVPDDVFIPVIGEGATGAALLKQPVDGVFFTGSFATGQKIAAEAGRRMVKVQLELGGKDPIYVCDDVDVKAAAAGLADGAFYNNGQSCCAVERIYVADAIHDAFVKAFVAEVNGFRLGDPMDETTYLGPVTRRAQLDVLKSQVKEAQKLGGKVLTGGKAIRRRGNWFEPTVVTGANHKMAIMRDESFGPVIGIARVANDDEAVALMNDNEYGLTAGVYTADEKRAKKILGRLQAGSVYWNCCDRVSPRLPWSGVKKSGIGLTLSTYGIQAFTRPKAWHLKRTPTS
ncbi:MAG TPA: aldehyde dehydrogenase family protein [Casimicrobiaceae bacterium]|nr:aldehyde dehydrogenase family protein [Casimicrobiaceae bacterium]